MLIKNKAVIQSPLIVTEFLSHNSLKEKLIKLIEETEQSKELKLKVNEVSKCDYDWSKDIKRDWLEYLLPKLTPHLTEVFTYLGYGAYEIKNIWFQRYIKNNIHDWHVHGDCQFTGVYYLELPFDEDLKTEIIQPIDQKTKFSANVKEGDILIFPSHVLHRAKRLQIDKKKIIISFNINAHIVDGQYPENY
jgi:hypothetical protein